MNDTEIKQKMYKEFENENSIINVKDELFKSMQNLKEDDLAHSSDFRLEDTMSAIVINHYKMDPHSHNEKIININDKQLKLKKLYSFSYQDSLYIIFDIFKKEISLFYNAPIYQCYLENTLSFITEEHIDINNFSDISHINYNIVSSFILSYKYLIYLLFHSITKTSCLRDEDVPSFLYSNTVLLNKPISLEFLEKILKNLENSEKKDENEKYIEQIISLVKLQKGIIGILLNFFNNKNTDNEKKEIKLTKDNYDKVINEILEEVNKIKYDIYPKEIEENKNIYKKELFKLMPAIGSYKICHIFDDKECIDKFKELLIDFKEIRRIFNTTNLYHLYKLIHNINHKKEINSPSFIIRHIIDINVSNEENNLFGNKATKKIFKNLFNEYQIGTKVNKDDKDNENDLLVQVINIYQEILKYELKNRARKVREARDLINNIIGLVIFIYKKEKEVNEENQNPHQHKSIKDLSRNFIKNFVVFILLKIMLSILFNCFYIDFFKFYELDYIFFICEEICNQINKHILLFAKNIDDSEILNENNIANSAKKKNLKEEKKIIFDEIYIYNSYKSAFQGLKLILYYIKYYKLIKIPELRENDIETRIINRCPFFKHCAMIINLSYEEFKRDYNENISQIEDEKYIDSSKEFIVNSKNYLNELIKADQQLRDIFMNGNDELKELNKVIISNSLIFAKVKKFKEERKEKEYLKFNININKYNSKFPLLEILK